MANAQSAHGSYIAQASEHSSAHITIFQAAAPERVDDEQVHAAKDKLAAMPTEELPDPAPPPAGSRLPWDRNHRFVGRARDLQKLAAALKNGGAAAVGQSPTVTGWGGVGKTQLATEFAYLYGQYFAGGVFWLNFAEPSAIPSEIAACGGAHALHLRHDFDSLPLNDQVGLVASAWHSDLPRLLIFDNCEAEELLEAWRPKQGACRVLVTSRRSTWRGELGVHTLPLDTLPRAESVRLLQAHRPDLSPDSADLDAIAAELGDLPLALHLAGNFLERYKFEPFGQPDRYLAALRRDDLLHHRSLAGGEGSPTGHDQHVARSFALSADRLDLSQPVDALARAALDRAAWFAAGEPIPRWLLRRSLAIDEADEAATLGFADAVTRLRDLGLIEQDDTTGDLILHRLIGAYARNTAADADAARQAVEAAVADAADQQNAAGLPGPLLAWQGHLRAVAETAAANDSAAAGQLFNSLGYHLKTIADYPGAWAAYERARAIAERAHGADHPNFAAVRNNLGSVLREQGDLDGAKTEYQAALAIDEKAYGPDHSAVANDRNNLGSVLYARGDLACAKREYQAALDIDKKAYGPEHPIVAIRRNNQGRVLYAQGDLDGAKREYRAALAINKKAFGPDHPNVATNRNNLGTVLHEQGDLGGAKAEFQAALAIDENAYGPDHPEVARYRTNLGAVLYQQGDAAGAKAQLARALNVFEATLGPDHPNTANARKWLAQLS